ncbi:MAG: S1C family serine protease [Candidatus Saccharimonadales bacterium]
MSEENLSKSETSDKSKKEVYRVASSRNPSKRTISFTVPSLPDMSSVSAIKESKHRNKLLMGAVIIFIILLSGFIGAWFNQHMNDNSSVSTVSLSNQKKIVTSQGQLISQIAKSVGPSVVSVNVNITSSSGNTGFFGFSQPTQEQAAGTGIILSTSGIIMTNRHVVPDGTTAVSVTLSDGTEFKDVSVLGRTSASDSLDVAFLKINDLKGYKVTPAVLGNSSQVQVGDSVVAIGNALGQYRNTVTSGIISGYGRAVQAGDSSGASSTTENLLDLFQTDAAINEGNSGGPLVNLNGQVIGMNTATASTAQNIGFAIPINDIVGLVNQVLKTGKFSQPYVGVRYIPLTPDVANTYGLSETSGAFIAPSSDPVNTPSVVPGSPAANAGLQERDIITQVDGANIDQNHSLTSLLDKYLPGDSVTLTIVRGSGTKHIDVVLGTQPTQ